jgi:hypothetical protein
MAYTLNMEKLLQLEYDTIDRENIAFESKASPAQLRKLEENVAWQDIKSHLKLIILNLRDELEVAGDNVTREEISQTQGQLLRCRLLLELPEFLASQKERELNDGEERE